MKKALAQVKGIVSSTITAFSGWNHWFTHINLCFLFGKSARKDSFIRGLNDTISECRGGAQ